ncbi:MAG: hypothetical protein E6J66_11960, partial [Deltaproteobacteria bacterium]
MKFSTSIRAAVVCALAFGGCVCDRHTPDGGFVLDAVAPSPVVAGVRAKVALKGAGFRVSVRSDLGAKTVTSDSISASAGPADLQSPVLRDDGLIDAVVPDTLEPGVWPVSLSIGGTAAGGTPALEVVAPIELALHAPADLASGESGALVLDVSSRAPTQVHVSLESQGVAPDGLAGISGLSLLSSLEADQTISLTASLDSLRSAAGGDTSIDVAVRWTLGPQTGVVHESAPLRALGQPALSASLDAPTEIEAGADVPFSAALTGPSSMAMGNVSAAFSAGGAAALANDPSTSGFALAAGAGMPFQGSLHGVSAGVTSLRFVARATAERGDAPPPLELSRDVIVRAGPLPVLASLSLPGQVEVGVPAVLHLQARNDGDVALTGAHVTVSATDGL